ncbi:MAG TPA: zinc ribbon domain-containing protein YjdM [Alphaproteobacteria bacterium]|nr:zinc ribbon domain-containing protein YjdM [Alphaproteobacteria bacterium]
MNGTSLCSKCGADYVFENEGMVSCLECGHEWAADSASLVDRDVAMVIKDSNGQVLQDGDTVTVIKDLKVKGSSSVVKVGTKVKNIRLVAGDHDIDCKISGIGAMGLKSEFVKKVVE